MKEEETIENELSATKEETNKPTILTEELLEEIIEEICPKIEVSTEKVQKLELDKTEFKKGLRDISEVCGMLTGLMSTGLSKEQSLELAQNIYLTRINNEKELKVIQFAPTQL